jgi:hypothetical protein
MTIQKDYVYKIVRKEPPTTLGNIWIGCVTFAVLAMMTYIAAHMLMHFMHVQPPNFNL